MAFSGIDPAVHSETTPAAVRRTREDRRATIHVVDDNQAVLELLRAALERHDYSVEVHASAEAFLSTFTSGRNDCLLVDNILPGMSGVDLIRQLRFEGCDIPCIIMTAYANFPVAVEAMKAGAADFLEKPVWGDALFRSIDLAIAQAGGKPVKFDARQAAATAISALTPRQRQVMDLMVRGVTNKQIAASLNISSRTVENHRALIMKRTGTGSLPDLVRLALRANNL